MTILLIFRLGIKPVPSGGGGALPVSGRGDLPERPRTGFDYIAWAANFSAWFAIGAVFRPVHLLAINLLYPEASYG